MFFPLSDPTVPYQEAPLAIFVCVHKEAHEEFDGFEHRVFSVERPVSNSRGFYSAY